MKKTILKIKNLKKIYHTKEDEILAINDLTFDVFDNEILAIVGPSGCGKSTILSILANIENKSSGNIIKRNIHTSYMLQSDSLFPWLTIYENAILGLKIENKLNEDNIKYVKYLINKYGLNDFINKYPDNLSGGMRQRVALIRTIATKPDLLLLDEPYSALDYQTRLTLSNDMYKIIKEEKISVIMITHDIGEAISMADRIIVLTKRPSTIKSIYDINLINKTNPINNRKDQNYNYYFDLIWRDLDVQI